MSYEKYKRSRDAAWEVLIDHKITSLPVRISEICKNDGITVRSYSKAEELISRLGFRRSAEDNDGFAVKINAKGYIFYNDTCSVQRQRFTVGHEYGHFINSDVASVPTNRNKEPNDSDDETETQANIISSRILSPSCVLWALGIHTADEIVKLCDISMASAQWRLKRMELLYEREKEFLAIRGRSCFLMSKKEQAVYNQFLPFIGQIKNRGQV